MARRPYEVVAECELAGLPTDGETARLRQQIEDARRDHPSVVRATLHPPAICRHGRYLLQAKFAVWADDSAAATAAVERLLRQAGIRAQAYPSGRALTDTDVPPEPAEPQRVA
ncbi:MAG: hypothetical protein QN173_06740 [Armatimonadota bacterium]|nr:hypothetical protein [Armatimonadota bacterium]MDR7401231.1 hypothetical protein [Armatimonadota bacterium]MDR7403010.1 hypothetical protein [Armatimonadota bacterium]MDR7437711.1 hypothetical protein [Armatimonadota bacterium]MDR7471884.1 hypothetical protein [Armatimonadota bacterium]